MKRLMSGLCLMAASVSFAHADVVVIGNTDGPDALTEDQVYNLYLNRSETLPDGTQAVPLEMGDSSDEKADFHDAVTGRSIGQLNSFWSQQVFTGRGEAPREVSGSGAMISTVSSTPGAIGYVMESDLDESVKVIYRP